jgi:hypothetical protein
MGRRGIDMALDLSRMPTLARACGTMPIPGDIVEALEIAAGDEAACRRAALAAGTSQDVVIEAVRFYLQHLLFPREADCYRVLGLAPGASRGTARLHMKLLLKWLHPDRNNGLESVYAERVIEAWRKLSDRPGQAAAAAASVATPSRPRMRSRLPLLEVHVLPRRRAGSNGLTLLTAGLLVLIVGASATYYFAPRLYEPLLADWRP